MTSLNLSAEELLATTRAVRKRLDFQREVPKELIRECVAAALQAPSGSNNLTMQFVVVTDAAKREAIANVYSKCWDIYTQLPSFAGAIAKEPGAEQAQQDRVVDSATFLSQNMAKSPALVIACNKGPRLDNLPAMATASILGNILPATWSFMR